MKHRKRRDERRVQVEVVIGCKVKDEWWSVHRRQRRLQVLVGSHMASDSGGGVLGGQNAPDSISTTQRET